MSSYNPCVCNNKHKAKRTHAVMPIFAQAEYIDPHDISSAKWYTLYTQKIALKP